jgi:hypothetical protein
MSRSWATGNTANYIDLGDITSARFLWADAWTLIFHGRVDATGDERSFVGKTNSEATMQFRLRTTNADPAQLDYRKTQNSPERWQTSAVFNHDEWYCISVSNDGSEAAGDMEVFGVSVESLTFVVDAFSGDNAADASDLTPPIILGKDGSPNNDPMDGDMAHVCYVEKVVTKNEVLAYAKDPWRQVMAWRAAGTVVEFYLPMIGESPEPDFSGSGNDGTINGTIGVGNNPPIAMFPAAIPEVFPTAAAGGSAGLNTETKRRAAVAISHYAMSPSVLPSGSLDATDRAVAGYGYWDSTGVAGANRLLLLVEPRLDGAFGGHLGL